MKKTLCVALLLVLAACYKYKPSYAERVAQGQITLGNVPLQHRTHEVLEAWVRRDPVNNVPGIDASEMDPEWIDLAAKEAFWGWGGCEVFDGVMHSLHSQLYYVGQGRYSLSPGVRNALRQCPATLLRFPSVMYTIEDVRAALQHPPWGLEAVARAKAERAWAITENIDKFPEWNTSCTWGLEHDPYLAARAGCPIT